MGHHSFSFILNVFDIFGVGMWNIALHIVQVISFSPNSHLERNIAASSHNIHMTLR